MWIGKDQIPNAVVAVVGDVIGAIYSHSTINTLFMESGFSGDPPPGNCIVKSQAWIKRAHDDRSRHPFDALGELLGNLSIRRPPSAGNNASCWSRINTALAKAGLQFDGQSKVVRESDSAVPGQPLTAANVNVPAVASEEKLDFLWNRHEQPAADANSASLAKTTSRDVFVVHGHDHGLKNAVARFVHTLGLNPVILHEKADAGHTIIEKLEAHASPGFAVVLCTKDDVGRDASEPASTLRPRPRQNVVLELGFFLGFLGRERVCAIVDPDVELPSDHDGVLFAPRGEWQQKLLERLSSANYQFSQDMITRALAIR
jgi:predicted nucleotide-binding protein